jgi:hypothetical protein
MGLGPSARKTKRATTPGPPAPAGCDRKPTSRGRVGSQAVRAMRRCSGGSFGPFHYNLHLIITRGTTPPALAITTIPYPEVVLLGWGLVPEGQESRHSRAPGSRGP